MPGKSRVIVATLVALLGVLAPLSSAAAESPLCTTATGSGSSTIQTTDGVDHTYYWRTPQTPPPDTGRPVLIYLHGYGGDASALAPGFEGSTDPDGALIVAPKSQEKGWYRASRDVDGHPLDGQFIERIIDELGTCNVGPGVAIDLNRVFLAGVSNGGYMTYALLTRQGLRDRIAAAVIHAGALHCDGGTADPDCTYTADPSGSQLHASTIRIMHVHGTSDTLVPAPAPRYWGGEYPFEPMNLWAQANGCYDDSIKGGKNDGVLKETFAIGDHTGRLYDLSGWSDDTHECSKYQLLLEENGGHGVPGQEPRMWAFLMDRPFTEPVPPVPAPTQAPPADVPVASAIPIYGTAADDVLYGTSGDDVIYARGGNDVVYGLGGNDRIYGGRGRDTIFGGDGNDVLRGGPSVDTCVGGLGTDRARHCERLRTVP